MSVVIFEEIQTKTPIVRMISVSDISVVSVNPDKMNIDQPAWIEIHIKTGYKFHVRLAETKCSPESVVLHICELMTASRASSVRFFCYSIYGY